MTPGWLNVSATGSADARDLAAITKTDYDAVLLMGPLYHLVIIEADRQTALRQASALSATRRSHCQRIHQPLRFSQRHALALCRLDRAARRSAIGHVKGRDPKNMRAGSFRGYFATPAEIAPLHEQIGFPETVVLAGVEPIVGGDDDSYNRLTGTQRALWLPNCCTRSVEPSIIGASRHLLYIGRKHSDLAIDRRVLLHPPTNLI